MELENIDKILPLILKKKDHQGQLLIQKYTQTFIYTLVQKHIFDLEVIYSENYKSTIDVFDFVQHMLKFINPPPQESLYVIMELVDFFKQISDVSQNNQSIRFYDISNYISQNNPKLNDEHGDLVDQEGIIQTRHLPLQKQFRSEQELKVRRVREIDTNPPLILGGGEEDVKRINKDRLYVDSSKKTNSQILRVFYSQQVKKIFVLHQYSDSIEVYYPDCTLFKVLKSSSPELRNVIISDIYWSEKQQRLGAILKEQRVCFWDTADWNDKFFTGQIEFTRIFYIQSIDRWLTTTMKGMIQVWDIRIQEVESCIDQKSPIVDIMEIDYLKLTCIVSTTAMQMWDMTVPKLLFKVNSKHSRLHSVAFFASYHLILTCGYDTKVNLFRLHKKYNDGDWVGQLSGHQSLVTSVSVIEGTPMVITSDDKHFIKTWDIRVLKCVQTFDLELRSPIGKIIVLPGIQGIGFVATRLLVMEFEGSQHRMSYWNKESVQQEDLPQGLVDQNSVPQRFEYDNIHKRLFICTKRDIRIYDLKNGRCFKIIRGIDDNGDDEITTFRSLQQHKKFIVGTQKGNLKIYDTETGNLIRIIQAHSNEISSISIDYHHGIMCTSSYDSNLIIWKEINAQSSNSYHQREFKYERIRELRNTHNQGPIILMEVSVYHNIIVTCSNSPLILFWNFEYGKLVGSFTLEEEAEPTSILVINGYSLVLVGDTRGYLYFLKVSVQVDTMNLELVATIAVDQSKEIEMKASSPRRKISKKTSQEIIQKQSSMILECQSPNRMQIKSVNNSLMKIKCTQEPIEQATRLACEIVSQKGQVNEIELIVGINSGKIKQYNLKKYFDILQILPVQSSKDKTNYNPYRQNREDFLTSIYNQKILHYFLGSLEFQVELKKLPHNTIQGHKDSLTYLSFMSLENEVVQQVGRLAKIVSCSSDQNVKIWDPKGLELCASFNINYPLPYKWNLVNDDEEVIRFKLGFTLKVISFIKKNYSSNLTPQMTRALDPILMIYGEKSRYLIKKQKVDSNLSSNQSPKTNMFITDLQPNENQIQEKLEDKIQNDNDTQVQVLSDEFTVRDIQWDKVKKYYKREIEGPTLKQLQELKKQHSFTQQLKRKQIQNAAQENHIGKKNHYVIDERNKDFKQTIQFLATGYRRQVLEECGLESQYPKYHSHTKQLSANLDFTSQKLKQLQQFPIVDQDRDLNSKEFTNQKKATQSIISAPQLEDQRVSTQNSIYSYQNNNPNLAKTTQTLPLPTLVPSHQRSSSTNFFQYAQSRQLNEKPDFKRIQSENLMSSERYRTKLRLLNENIGALSSDLNDNQKNVVNTLGVNLMRKTSSNLFAKIVNNLDRKLKSSKFSFQSTATNFSRNHNSSIQQRNSISNDLRNSQNSTTQKHFQISKMQILGDKLTFSTEKK